jgi:predicted O-methyltransferase YrrM
MMLPKPPIDREPLFQLRSFANDEEFTLHWQMTTCERFALQGLLRRLRPSLSLEVGTYLGGSLSLRVLSRFSEAVISVDIDPQVAIRLAGKFPNVGPDIADVVSELNEQRRPIGFVLLDGDHRGKGVRRDIEALLELEPQQQVVFVLHDSFNPGCREGMRTANWAKSRLFDLDFIPGVYH